MKFLRRTAAVILIALLCVCVFGGFVVPEDMDKSIVTIYSTDGRILQMRENDAQQYLNDGWTKNFKDVMTKVWKSDGSSKSILKGQTALYTNSGWSTDKGDVTAIMTDKDGNEKEIFKDNIELYKEKGWKLKRENKQENKQVKFQFAGLTRYRDSVSIIKEQVVLFFSSKKTPTLEVEVFLL